MAEILPTPDAGTWLKITGTSDVADPPRAGTWLRIVGSVGPSEVRAGTWLRIDSVSFSTKVNRVSVGMILAN